MYPMNLERKARVDVMRARLESGELVLNAADLSELSISSTLHRAVRAHLGLSVDEAAKAMGIDKMSVKSREQHKPTRGARIDVLTEHLTAMGYEVELRVRQR